MNRIENAPVLLASIAVLAACGAGETAHEGRTSGIDVQSRAPALLFPQGPVGNSVGIAPAPGVDAENTREIP